MAWMWAKGEQKVDHGNYKESADKSEAEISDIWEIIVQAIIHNVEV